jgi:ribosomal protein S18 acetylase RimI-like enzyme
MLKDFALPDGLILRAATVADGVLMEALFRCTREHFYAMPMPRQQIDLLLAQQYQLQQASYARQWPGAYPLIIERMGKGIGKIVLDENETAVHIVDLVIAPEMRGKGYGTTLLQALQAAAGERRIALSVDRQNPAAKKLYRNLGFQVETVSETHEAMSWAPSTEGISGKLHAEIFYNKQHITT